MTRSELLAFMRQHVYAVAATRDESLAVAGGEDGIFRVWNGTNAQELFKFEAPKPPGDNAQANAK